MSEFDLSPSVVNKWIGCDHYLTLEIQRRRRSLNPDRIHDNFFKDNDIFSMPTNFTQMLFKKGLLHEKECLEKYKTTFGDEKVLEIEGPLEEPRDSWTSWINRVGDPFNEGYEVVCQMPFKHDRMRGIADFLERRVYKEIDGDGNVHERISYEPVDSKLTRNSAKISHIKQLLYYSEAISDQQKFPNLSIPRNLHVALGKQKLDENEQETRNEPERLEGLPILDSFEVKKFWWQWDRTRDIISEVLNLSDEKLKIRTQPEWCSSCSHCEFLLEECSPKWPDDALHGLSGIHKSHIETLENSGINSIGKLALLEPTDLPEFEEHWNLSTLIKSEFEAIRPIVESKATVTRENLLRIVEEHQQVANDEGKNYLSDLEPYVVAKLWRQARLQTIKFHTARCPACNSQITEASTTCPVCSAELINQDGSLLQGDGRVMTYLFSTEEMKERMVERSRDTDFPEWQLTESLSHLPEMTDYDVYIDFEGHPFWTVEADIIFLFGYLAKINDEWTYVSLWAHDDEGYPTKEMERLKALEFMTFLYERWTQHPEMKIYHYNHTERYLLSQLTDSDESMGSIVEIFENYLQTGQLALAQSETMNSNLDELIKHGVFVDLLAIARNSIQVGCKGYSLKKLEQLAGFTRGYSNELDKQHSVPATDSTDADLPDDPISKRSREWFRVLGITNGDEISAGAGAVYEYELYCNHSLYCDSDGNELKRDNQILKKIEDYNKDDVEATKEVHRWLLQMRSDSSEHEYEEADYQRPSDSESSMRQRIAEVQKELAGMWQ